jgi:paraquat-inducible protein B
MENKRQKLQFQISEYQKQVRNRESGLFKASINNELRDMENKRQKLQFQISGYQKQVRNRESGLFKASINNELRDMENKRQKLQFQIYIRVPETGKKRGINQVYSIIITN